MTEPMALDQPISPAVAVTRGFVPASAGFDPNSLANADVDRRRASEAKMAAMALGTAAVLSVLRATLLPLMLANVPPEKLEKFASFISPDVRLAHWALAGVFILCCLWALRQPLYAAGAAMVLYLAYAVPDVLGNPNLIGGGHIGKLVTLGILGRALFAAVMHRLLLDERTHN